MLSPFKVATNKHSLANEGTAQNCASPALTCLGQSTFHGSALFVEIQAVDGALLWCRDGQVAVSNHNIAHNIKLTLLSEIQS